jgi:hypothetical protein
MSSFTEWLYKRNKDTFDENNFQFGGVKPASEWRSKWFNIARNYIKKMQMEGEKEAAMSSIWRINQVAKKLEELGEEPLTANRVAVIASDEESGNPELDARFEEIIDALERS